MKGFSYTPRLGNINGTIKEFKFYTSSDAINWILSAEGEFGNIKNNPVRQEIRFKEKINAQFIKLEALSEVNGNPWASAGEIGVITE